MTDDKLVPIDDGHRLVAKALAGKTLTPSEKYFIDWFNNDPPPTRMGKGDRDYLATIARRHKVKPCL